MLNARVGICWHWNIYKSELYFFSALRYIYIFKGIFNGIQTKFCALDLLVVEPFLVKWYRSRASERKTKKTKKNQFSENFHSKKVRAVEFCYLKQIPNVIINYTKQNNEKHGLAHIQCSKKNIIFYSNSSEWRRKRIVFDCQPH